MEAAPDAVRSLEHEADEVVAVSGPARLLAVGAHYRNFPQVPDDEGAAYLDRARPKAAAGGVAP